MNRQGRTSWRQRARDFISDVIVEIIAGAIILVIATLFGTRDDLSSQAVAWVKDPIHQTILGVLGVITVAATSIWIWHREPPVSQPKPELSELEAPWQARIGMLWALSEAGLHEQKGQQDLKGQAWISAWESSAEAIHELLDYFHPDTGTSLLNTIEGLKARGAVKDEEWREIRHSLDTVLRDIAPQTMEVCQVQPPFGSEIADSLQRTLAGMEETYQQAMQLRENRAWRKAFKLLRSIPGYRDANRQAVLDVATTLAIAVVVPIVIVAVFIIGPDISFPDIISELGTNLRPQTASSSVIDTSTATVTPSTPAVTATRTAPITFIITCANNETHEVQAGEPISISISSAVLIEPSLAPKDGHAAKPERLHEWPSEEGKLFSYAPTDPEPDIVSFSFLINENTGEVTSRSLFIRVVPPGGGLCD